MAVSIILFKSLAIVSLSDNNSDRVLVPKIFLKYNKKRRIRRIHTSLNLKNSLILDTLIHYFKLLKIYLVVATSGLWQTGGG